MLAVDDGAGNLVNVNTSDVQGATIGTINYTTGAISLTWLAAPGASEDVSCQYVPYVASRPVAALFFNNQFTLRPVPDQAYRVDVEIYKAPSALLAANSDPEIRQWWQYIAYGAAKKIFEDQQDIDSIQKIMPEFDQQQRLCLRKTIVQQTPQRSSTIYSEQQQWPYGNFNNQLTF